MKKRIKFTKGVCLLISLLMIFALAACSDGPTKEVFSSGNSSEAKTSENFGINETAVFDNPKITAVEMQESHGKQFFEAESGKIFVGIKLNIEKFQMLLI